ncbi:MAG: double-strand break repair protein AddB [Alphaproteobacteria bacterium]|nr:double-strand break repair protein AddB [Alphaproteobacteria bacterium]MBL6939682.1 double-strand break repair protein AddB [Alphaproteobacteria bacterium]MBL7096996.1 double-strand break repair protein AddB [Alphaproteobacteria bacterium]
MANVFTIPPSANFAEALARGLIGQLGEGPFALADAVIYLPTRRAQRTFGDAFARVLGGAALLPQFKALGDVEEDEFIFDAETLDLPPAITPMRRMLLLATMVRRWYRATHGEDIGFAQATALAEGLAKVMDEVETLGADLAHLDRVIPGTLAAHWEKVKDFLDLLNREWPKILTDEGRIGPATRRNLALQALAARLKSAPSEGPVIAAGSTGSIPATAALMQAILEHPNGSVVLPGLDRELDLASWNDLDPGHPQFGMKQLLGRLGLQRADVRDWCGDGNARRERVLREALRPAPTTDAWRAIADAKDARSIGDGLAGVSLVEAADPMEEAITIAVILREALETPGKTAALVTPDRTLGRRVASELQRWDIEVDKSAGVPLSDTPPGTFLSLLAEAAAERFAPVPLLALLRHPFATLGRSDTAGFRATVRALDLALRGPRPDVGLDGIATFLRKARPRAEGLRDWFASVSTALRPIEAATSNPDVKLAELVAAHLASADALAGSALWQAEAGEAMARFLEELIDAANAIPPVEPGAYAALFRKLALRQTVRRNRSGHPRLAILGPLEARLQSFDTIVLGGLNEGTWPRTPGADPWFSRPMRLALGLEQPERAIGQSAHDFAMLCAGPRVVLARAMKADGVPTIASRWVQRLNQLATGLGLRNERADVLAPAEDYLLLARSLYDAGKPQRIDPPSFAPPVEARPKRLPITDIENWLRDPFTIYAKRVLNLRILDPLDAEIGPMERGTAVHRILERFVKEQPGPLGSDAAAKLCAIAEEVYAADGIPGSVLALWRPRFARAAEWFVEIERERRTGIALSFTEIEGRAKLTPDFELYGIADRIDVLANGGAAILDYKTGNPPTNPQIEIFLTPQLLLEAALLKAGGFPGIGERDARELLYIQISGGRKAGKIQPIDDLGLINGAVAKLLAHIALFEQEATPYLSRPHPQFAREEGDYDHLARVREWSVSGWEVPEE